jgi:hypothetical protein
MRFTDCLRTSEATVDASSVRSSIQSVVFDTAEARLSPIASNMTEGAAPVPVIWLVRVVWRLRRLHERPEPPRPLRSAVGVRGAVAASVDASLGDSLRGVLGAT